MKLAKVKEIEKRKKYCFKPCVNLKLYYPNIMYHIITQFPIKLNVDKEEYVKLNYKIKCEACNKELSDNIKLKDFKCPKGYW